VLCTHQLAAIKHADQVILLERVSDGETKGDEAPTEASTVDSRVAFCGHPDGFREKYPDMVGEVMSRQRSGSSEDMARQKSDDKESKPQPKSANAGKLVEKETELVGSVSLDVYKTYMRAAGGFGLAFAVLGGIIFGQALQTAADSWVSFWSDHSAHKPDKIWVSSSVGLAGYATLSITAFFGIFGTSALFRLTALNAARSFHRQLLTRMLHLPMAFYDTTPLGRVLNRFSKDVYAIDEVLQSVLYMYLTTLARVAATLVVIAVATPWFVVIIFPLLWVYRYTQNYYVPSSRQLKRIESTLRSPIFSHFSETLDGVASIRAYGQQSNFIAESTNRVQRNMRAYYLNVSSNRWLAVRLETLGSAIVTAAGLLAIFSRDYLSAGVAGLSISYALSVTQSLNWVVRMTSDRETNIVSVERIREYLHKTPEPPRTRPEDPPAGTWPTEGKIVFNDIKLKYRPELEFVLKGLTLEVQPHEKIGICGRTGAGKSSLLNVLLRIVDPLEGKTIIDDKDIVTLGVHCVRRAITIIPQDPVLFSGTLRFNLDPLEEKGSEELWKALRRAHLSAHVQALSANSASSSSENETEGRGLPSAATDALDTLVAESGQNFSLGQRQQMCLARALLRSNKILLLDEATSAVDMETDALIQSTIRKEFDTHTVLCIAHRISTVMESDRVCVVDAGKIAEVGNPKVLAQQEGSRFHRLAKLDKSH